MDPFLGLGLALHLHLIYAHRQVMRQLLEAAGLSVVCMKGKANMTEATPAKPPERASHVPALGSREVHRCASVQSVSAGMYVHIHMEPWLICVCRLPYCINTFAFSLRSHSQPGIPSAHEICSETVTEGRC